MLQHVWKSPLAQVGVLLGGATVCYLTAFFNGHVSPYLPFISETGAFVPEQCIFSYTLSIGSFFGVLSVSCRFLVVSKALPPDRRRLHKLNRLGLLAGLASMLGLDGVAAFPVSSILWAHLLTAVVHFGCGSFYLFAQTLLSHQAPPPHRAPALVAGRLLLALINLACLALLGVCFPMGYVKWTKSNEKLPAFKTPSDKGFNLLIASSVFEWMFEVTLLTFFLTMLTEFRRFEIKVDAAKKSEDLPPVAAPPEVNV